MSVANTTTRPRPTPGKLAIAAASFAVVLVVTWGLPGFWPLVSVGIATVVAVGTLRSRKQWMPALGVGTIMGAATGFAIVFDRATEILVDYPAGKWPLAVLLMGVSFLVGLWAYRAPVPPPRVDMRNMAVSATDYSAFPLAVLVAFVTFTWGASTAAQVGERVAAVVVSFAVAIGTGLAAAQRLSPVRDDAGRDSLENDDTSQTGIDT